MVSGGGRDAASPSTPSRGFVDMILVTGSSDICWTDFDEAHSQRVSATNVTERFESINGRKRYSHRFDGSGFMMVVIEALWITACRSSI